MASSASAIGQAVVDVLEGMSRVGSGNAHRRGYDILERATSTCCFRVRCTHGAAKQVAFGSTTSTLSEDVTVTAEGFVRLETDEDDWYDAQDHLIHDMKTTFDDYQTLSGIVEGAVLTEWDIPEIELNVSGIVWQPIRFTISVNNM